MPSLSELSNIIQALTQKISRHETGILQKKLAEMELQYSNHSAVTPLVKMMSALGRYLHSKNEDAHPDAVPVLLSIVVQLENITGSRMSGPDKDKISRIVSGEIQKYKTLQNKITSTPVIPESDRQGLKTAIMAIDREVSDTDLENFEKTVAGLMSKYRPYKIHHTFLKILHAMGHYIRSCKPLAREEAITLLHSVWKDFDPVVQNPDLSFQDKKLRLEKTIRQFKKFKAGMSKTPVFKQSGPRSGEMANAPKDPVCEPGNVMDALFSIKASAADDLLEAIHLKDVYGTDQGRFSEMVDQVRDLPRPESDILERIKTSMEGLDKLEPGPAIHSIQNDILQLKACRHHDPEKKALVELLALMMECLEHQAVRPHEGKKTASSLWKRIRTLFAS